MSDNVYRVLMGDNAPFAGLANVSYYNRTWKGEIVDVHYDNLLTKDVNGNTVLNKDIYRTVDIRWIEGKPFTSKNVHIPEYLSYKGGYGINYLPMKGDIVLASFSPTNEPYIITIVARCSVYEHGAIYDDGTVVKNEYGDPLIDSVIDEQIRPTPFRRVAPGDISITALNNNCELFLSKEGTAKIIAREPKYSDMGGVQCGNRLWEISLGNEIYDEGNSELKKNSLGNNIQFQILGHQNGCKVNFDNKGNIEILTNGNSVILTKDNVKISDNKGNSITLNNQGIQLGDNANFSAVLGESLVNLLNTMITTFNTHTHQGVMSGPSTTPPPSMPMIMTDILSKKIKLKE